MGISGRGIQCPLCGARCAMAGQMRRVSGGHGGMCGLVSCLVAVRTSGWQLPLYSVSSHVHVHAHACDVHVHVYVHVYMYMKSMKRLRAIAL